jgi:alpha-tubulin suppressor-like RCC1 family protein
MKRLLTLLVNAALCGYLIVGGIVPVQANQPVGQSRQRAVVVSTVYLPLVLVSRPTVPTVIATSLSSGQNHNCALIQGGGVKCWGYNQDGELGNGASGDYQPIPVDVVGLGGKVVSISTGYKHTCVLMDTGGVKCWGFNADGQLGDGTRTNRSTPVDVSGLTSGVVQIRAGGYHTCALKSTDVMRCWGDNTFGQLGDKSTNDALFPVKVSVLTTEVVSSFRLGEYHTCIATTAGAVECWGYNGFGQLGNNSRVDSLTPVKVSGLTSGVSVFGAGASHTCARLADTSLVCWGYNGYGQLGDGTTTDRLSPVLVSGLTSGVEGLSPGVRHTCVYKKNDTIVCFGYNYYGQLGDGTTKDKHVPTTVNGLPSGLDSIRVGLFHSCALLKSGGIRCWGNNDFGQLGNGSTTSRNVPVSVIGFP